MPAGADAVQYEKLMQVGYNDAWSQFGDIGDHIGPMTRSFARNMLGPLLVSGAFPPVPPLPTTNPAR